MGISEEDFFDMLPREFTRRRRVWLERQEEEEKGAWRRTLLIVNTVRGALDASPLSLDDLKEKARAQAEAPSREEWEADLARIAKAKKRAAEA